LEEKPPISKVAASILNRKSQSADKGCSSGLGFVGGANTSSPYKTAVSQNIHICLRVLWYNLSNGKGHEIWQVECEKPV